MIYGVDGGGGGGGGGAGGNQVKLGVAAAVDSKSPADSRADLVRDVSDAKSLDRRHRSHTHTPIHACTNQI